MALWAVVPVKGLATAKGRLAPLLTPAEREALAAALLADVLAALRAAPAVARVLVVSPDAAALSLAEEWGAAPLAELGATGPGDYPPGEEAGLNAALDYAATVAAGGGASALLTLPADLPLVTPADVAAVVANPPPAPSVALAPTVDGGTGALLRQPPLALPARFGPDSVRAHLQAAAARGVAARLVWRRGLGLDVDRPDDLARLAALPRPTRTRALVAAWRAADRWPADATATPERCSTGSGS
ncbi:MAG TPA: 2-phospho-L-lactate guanylyltransferase [Chloroflexota bacterium]|nr:2-phospho-L-lactate guanylyltransferase [Chloroflexota bacterium]